MIQQEKLKITGIILAGGQSQRMGKNKALLSFNGKSMVEHTQALLQQIPQVQEILISGNYPEYSCIPDLIPDKGPLGGLYSAMISLEEKANSLLLIPIDMPQFRTVYLEKMVGTMESGLWESCCFEGYPLPLLIKVNSKIKNLIESRIKNPEGKLSIKGLVQTLKSQVLPILSEERPHFMNTNTPEEWEQHLKTC